MSDIIGAHDNEDLADATQGSQKIATTSQTDRMTRFYRRQARLFDITRAPVLLRRAEVRRRLQPGDRIAEIGCGTGHNLAEIAAAVGPGGEVIGIECAASMAERARRHAGPGTRVLEAEYAPGHSLEGVRDLDAILFSYSLSMMSDADRILAQAQMDLRPGGRLVVVDFLHSRWRWLRRWMQRCHVELGEARIHLIRERFADVTVERHTAHAGLWTYACITACDPRSSC